MGKKNDGVQKKLRGESGFEEYYSGLFGKRWEALRGALKKDNVHVEWKVSGMAPYYLDPASVFAALQLPVSGAERFLDLCAAPGGKTLVIAARMPLDATLVSNERSASRKQRLVQVCDSSLPAEVRSRVRISCGDGAKWCRTQGECYQRILLDVPCSSERHVLNDPRYLSEWSPARIKSLALEQWALLSCAYRLLEKGGYLLYSTCALNPTENDGVLRRLFKKFPDAESVFASSMPALPDDCMKFTGSKISLVPERTEFGFHILPDVQGGAGPIWFSLVRKGGCPGVEEVSGASL